ncbi:MAG: TauD/TfdA family dioxygenase [Proteobacteria bacterium]|nr:TauD/TfdA family dioxygenase [Pseudomonadota bacterium]
MPRLDPFVHPAAWKATDFQGKKNDISVDLSAGHVAALQSALVELKASGKTAPELIGRHDFPLPGIADDIAHWHREVVQGRGLLVLRGFPVDQLSLQDIELVWFGIGTHFGRAVSQSAMGDLVGHVVNVGGQDAKERAYRNARELRLHTDRCDVVGMLSIRPAMSGGFSGYASALAIYNEMIRTRPDLLTPLWNGFHLHRFGEELPGEQPYSAVPIPILSEKDSVPTVILMRGYIDMAVEEFGLPFTDRDREAMDLFEEIGNRPDFRVDFLLERGEAAIFNNCWTVHRRTAFDDNPDPLLKRHLLRLWLNGWDSRIAVDAVDIHKGADGIPRQQGKTTYYAKRRDQVSG